LRFQLEGKSSPSLEVQMEFLSDKYGWTPNEIREQSLADIEYYLEINRMKSKLQKKNKK